MPPSKQEALQVHEEEEDGATKQEPAVLFQGITTQEEDAIEKRGRLFGNGNNNDVFGRTLVSHRDNDHTTPFLAPGAKKGRHQTTTNSRRQAPLAGSGLLPSTSQHRATLDVPLRYNGFYSSNNNNKQDPIVSLQKRSRFTVLSSVPLYKRSSAKHRQEVTGLLTGGTSLRGRAGYTSGSADVRFSHTAHDVGTSGNKSQCTSLNAGLGLAPNISATAAGGLTAASAGSVIESSRSSLPTLHFGAGTSIHDPSVNRAASILSNLTFPQPWTDPTKCALSLSTMLQRHAVGPYSFWCPLIFRTQTLADPVSFNLKSISLSISPGALLLPTNNNNLGRPQSQQKNSQPQSRNVSSSRSWNLRIGCSKSRDHNTNKFRPFAGVSSSLWLPQIKCLSSRKLLHLSMQWNGARRWYLSGYFSQPMISNRTKTTNRNLSVGVTLNLSDTVAAGKSGILSWILSWTEGDFTLRVPILLSPSASISTFCYNQIFQLVFLSFIQQVVGSMFWPSLVEKGKGDEEQKPQRDRETFLENSKARQEAILQQNFMERNAKMRMKAENERKGLVILNAIYFLSQDGRSEPSTATVSLDVTIPLNFWINESKLELFGKRSLMLGFCDLLAVESSDGLAPSVEAKKLPRDDSVGWLAQAGSWWSGDNTNGSTRDPPITTAIPKLSVRYDFSGRIYEILIDEDEEIALPHPRASLIP